MNSHNHDEDIKDILVSSRTIAVVGLSPNENRPSNIVARYLLDAGFQVVPVNPGQNSILGITCYPDILSIPAKIDIVDIFRNSADVPPIVEQAIQVGARAVWMQQGITNEAAAVRAAEAGLFCIMDSCIKVEYARLAA